MREGGTAGGGVKDPAHIDSEWNIARRLIDGVVVREVRSIVTANGVTTEICRSDWGIDATTACTADRSASPE